MSSKIDYNAYEYFQKPFAEESRAITEALSHQVQRQITKTIKAGKIIEVDIYPEFKKGIKKNKHGQTAESQKRINQRNCERHITQILDSNFEEYKSIFTTLTYFDKNLPDTREQADNNVRNFIRRLERFIGKVNERVMANKQVTFFEEDNKEITNTDFYKALDEYSNNKRKRSNYPIIVEYVARKVNRRLDTLKYIYVTEVSKRERLHHHLVIELPLDGLEYDILDTFWNLGKRKFKLRVKSYDGKGLWKLGRYLSKEYKNREDFTKTFKCSANLHKPYQKGNYTTNKTKCSKKQAENMTDTAKAVAWFAKNYPKYELLDLPTVYVSDYFGGYYIYARLKEK